MYNDAINPLVSIVILGYNHVDYTKMAIDSIYQYSEDIEFELITVNNGSSDGTKDYFDSLPNKKKIHLEKNVGPVNGFNIGMKAAEGKYIAVVCNDFVFTTNWLKNLVVCIETDERIGYVSPGSSSISNLQQINGNYRDIDEMQEFAKTYNISDPNKWEERVRLLPNVLFVKKEVLDVVGYYDPKFYFGEFADDDLSFRIRRAGYKMIYAADTFTYHFGSVTTDKEHKENKSLEVSRQIFVKKHGLDAWTDVHYDLNLINSIDYETVEDKNNVKILGIDPRCGATILQVKNKFRNFGRHDVKLYSYTKDYKYVQDLETICERAYCGDYQDIGRRIGNEKFDFIVIGEQAQHYNSFIELIDTLKTLLEENGKIIFTIDNMMNYAIFFKMMIGMDTGTSDNGVIKFFDLDKLEKEFKRLSLQIKDIKFETVDIGSNNQMLVDNLVNVFPENSRDIVKLRLSTNRYLISLGIG